MALDHYRVSAIVRTQDSEGEVNITMIKRTLIAVLAALCLSACAEIPDAPLIAHVTTPKDKVATDYIIGPGDQFNVFVWRNPDLTTSVRVRPDGRISVPLIDDLTVAGKTPTETERVIEEKLSEYLQDVKVTVIMSDFVGPNNRLIRIVGEVDKPQSIGYHNGMTLLDVMTQAGGLNQFAAGNRATLTRAIGDSPTLYRIRLDDLLKRGDISANIEVAPGDIITIPQSWF